MKLLDLSLSTPEENLRRDESLLDESEAGSAGETLRFWESKRLFVVLGFSKRVELDVRTDNCKSDDVPILRRSSGGGTVLQGPGCLNYALILDIRKRPEISNLKKTNCFMMTSIRDAVGPLLPGIEYAGLTDLALNGKKFSGNAQRRKRNFCLFHGTFLLNMNLDWVTRYLKVPEDQPEYRRNRPHQDFLTNIPLSRNQIKSALTNLWI